MKFYEIRAQSPTVAELWIYEDIGEDFWGEGVSAKTLVQEIAALQVPDIHVHINSAGGSVWDGQAIYTALRRHPANVTTFVDGLAASIASVVAMAGSPVVMSENALMMIHDPYALAMGTGADLRAAADVLDKVGDTITGVYADKSGKAREDIAAAMTEETWFTAEEAIAFGLADEMSEYLPVAALAVDAKTISRFKHPPAALAVAEADPVPASSAPEAEPDESDEVDAGPPPDEADVPGPDADTTPPVAAVADFELERIRLRKGR